MIVEMRTYVLHPGQQGAFLAAMEEEGIAIERSILGQMVGFYTSEIGTLNQVIHMWAYESYEDREQRRARLAASSDWARFVKRVLPMIRDMENRVLKPAPFAALDTLDWQGAQTA